MVLVCAVTVSAGAAVGADSDAGLRGVLARVVEANERWERLAARLQAENAVLRAENERVSAELAVLQRLVFGRSSERTRPQAPVGDDDQSGFGPAQRQPGGDRPRRGPGARAGRRDYSHLPRVEVVWDSPESGYCCQGCSSPFDALGDHTFEQVDWRVTVRGGGAPPPPVSASLLV
jgi:transposase